MSEDVNSYEPCVYLPGQCLRSDKSAVFEVECNTKEDERWPRCKICRISFHKHCLSRQTDFKCGHLSQTLFVETNRLQMWTQRFTYLRLQMWTQRFRYLRLQMWTQRFRYLKKEIKTNSTTTKR